MAGQLIDPEQEKVVEETRETLYDDVEMTEEEVASAEPEPEVVEDTLPDKYKGKTIADIAKMHQEAESALGRQSNEVGELRAAFDEFVTSSVKKSEAPVEKEEEVDFFIDPQAAVQRAIDNHPKLRQAEAVTVEMKKRDSIGRLRSDFPDMEKTLSDPAFQAWVGKSKIRQQLFRNADKSYDYDSAAELFNNFAERQDVVEATKANQVAAQANEVRNASTGNTRSNPDARRTKKVYRRSDIRKLMNTDPSRYEAMEAEILQAYAEGRVK